MYVKTLIIGPTVQQCEHVKNWIARHGSELPEGVNRISSCPPLGQQPYSSLAMSTAIHALRDLEGRKLETIVIVDYPHWRPAPGEMTALWNRIQLHRACGAEVVWW